MSVSHQKLALKKSWLDRLTRVTYLTNLIPEIDGLRFFAIITVVILHLNTNLRRASPVKFIPGPEYDWFGRIAAEAGLGVYVFFAISGFILALPFARYFFEKTSKVELKDYYLRRLTRLEPPFAISIIFFYLMMVIVLGKSLSALFPNFLASLFYVHYFVYDERSVLNPVTWSLETEVQFYILAPFLAYVFAINQPLVRRIILLSAMIAGFWITQHYWREFNKFHLSTSIFYYLPRFLTGFLFADLFLSYRGYFTTKHFGWDILGLSAIFGLFYFSTSGTWYELMSFSLLIIILFIAAFKGILFNWFFSNKFIVVTGGMCYTIYLFHYQFLAMAMKFTAKLYIGNSFAVNFLLQALIILPLLFLFSALFFLTIEKPCMRRDWPGELYNKLRNIF
jgi:peptidoglycan/LPS O-acetylase OafA/YrhL